MFGVFGMLALAVLHKLEWLRIGADLIFLLAGALPIALGALRSTWKRDLGPAA